MPFKFEKRCNLLILKNIHQLGKSLSYSFPSYRDSVFPPPKEEREGSTHTWAKEERERERGRQFVNSLCPWRKARRGNRPWVVLNDAKGEWVCTRMYQESAQELMATRSFAKKSRNKHISGSVAPPLSTAFLKQGKLTNEGKKEAAFMSWWALWRREQETLLDEFSLGWVLTPRFFGFFLLKYCTMQSA